MTNPSEEEEHQLEPAARSEIPTDESSIDKVVEQPAEQENLETTLLRPDSINFLNGYYLREGGVPWKPFRDYRERKSLIIRREQWGMFPATDGTNRYTKLDDDDLFSLIRRCGGFIRFSVFEDDIPEDKTGDYSEITYPKWVLTKSHYGNDKASYWALYVANDHSETTIAKILQDAEKSGIRGVSSDNKPPSFKLDVSIQRVSYKHLYAIMYSILATNYERSHGCSEGFCNPDINR